MNARTKKMSRLHLMKVLKLALPSMLYVSTRRTVAARVQSTSTAEQNNLNTTSGKGIPVAQMAVKLLRLYGYCTSLPKYFILDSNI